MIIATPTQAYEQKGRWFKLKAVSPNEDYEPNKQLIGKSFKILNSLFQVQMLSGKLEILSYGSEVELLNQKTK